MAGVDGQQDGAPLENAPPLTLDNALAAVKGVQDWDLLSASFGVDIDKHQYDSNEARLKAAVEGFLLGNGDYQPTWRALIYCLDRAEEVALADKIRSFASEPVQDPTLTTDAVAEVMELVKDSISLQSGASTELAIIPSSRFEAIERKCSTKRETANECASYYVQCHPQASWTHLVCPLYLHGEFAAVEKVKPFLPLRDLTITTDKLVEMFATVRDDLVEYIGLWLSLPGSKRDEIKRSFQSPTRCRDAYLDLYTSDHPYPMWKTIAAVLRYARLSRQADMVESTYVQVSERTQRNFDEAMKEGVLMIRNGNSFMMGAGGSGKTLTLLSILKEKRPEVRQSTPCAKKAIRTVAQYKIGVSTKTAGKLLFVRITDDQFSDMLSTSATRVLQSRIPRATRHDQPATSEAGHSLDARLSQVSIRPTDASSLVPASQGDNSSRFMSVAFEHGGVHRELLVRMNAGSKSGDHLDDKDLFDFRDSGGQSMFHEILPVFVNNTMIGFLTVKLNERLDHHPMVEYYASGERVGEPFRSPFSHEQIFRHCMRALQSTCESGKCPKIVFIGTHKDLEYQCKDEDLEAKNRKLHSIIPPEMKKNVISYKGDSLIFPINALNPGDDDEAVLDVLRRLMYNELKKLPQTPIPLRYFGLETAFQRLAKEKNKGVLSIEECFKEAEALQFTREGFMDALKYLKEKKLILYYETILPGVVFIDVQVLLDKITELVEYCLRIAAGSCPEGMTLEAFELLKACGFISREILSRFKSRYIKDLFEEDHLIKLFEHLLIVAKIAEDQYLMSCLLRVEAVLQPLSDPESQVVPTLLFYFGKDGPKLGVYCFLLSSLITDAKWELLMENGKPVQLSRNRVRFAIPGSPGFVTITDSFSTSFHVDITFPSDTSLAQKLEICERACPNIRETILASIRNASRRLNYTNSIPEAAFLCTKHQATSLHPATIAAQCNLLTCTTYPASVCCTMTDRHKLWLGKPVAAHSPAASASLSTGHLTINDLAGVLRSVWEARSKWYTIGLELGTSPGTLDAIKTGAKENPDDCIMAMIKDWLSNGKPRPTWAAVAKALKSPMVGYEHLAEQLPCTMQSHDSASRKRLRSPSSQEEPLLQLVTKK